MRGSGQPRGAAAPETARWSPGRRRVAVDPAADRKLRRPLDAQMVTALVRRRRRVCVFSPRSAATFLQDARGNRSHFTTPALSLSRQPGHAAKKKKRCSEEEKSLGSSRICIGRVHVGSDRADQNVPSVSVCRLHQHACRARPLATSCTSGPGLQPAGQLEPLGRRSRRIDLAGPLTGL
jgi:hypothetical protein